VGGVKIDLAQDFRDLLCAFVDHEVRFLVVGAYALAILGRPRATGDLDVWIESTAKNAARAHAALEAFGAPLHDLTRDDLARPGTVFQIGLPPLRIDILTRITGVEFAPAWERRTEADFEGVRVPVIGREDFLANKRALGRTKDLADAERLDPPKPGQGE
jgi:predicted nucleotidyltransferase